MKIWDSKDYKADQLEQFKLIYDYIKFHIGLYLATPPVIAIMAEPFDVQRSVCFKIGMGAMILIYFVSGIDAGLFMGRHINSPWEDGFLKEFNNEAFSGRRRFMHHYLYWIGLVAGLLGLGIAIYMK